MHRNGMSGSDLLGVPLWSVPLPLLALCLVSLWDLGIVCKVSRVGIWVLRWAGFGSCFSV